MPSAPTFALWLKQRRKALDLTQTDLARLVGCAPVTIQKIEEGQRRPSRQIAELLAEHLAIPAPERDAFLRLARAALSATPDLPPIPSPAPSPSPAAPSRLPSPLTPLVGRATEVAAVTRLLASPDVRLITLLGLPGVGKTRLSIALARQCTDAFADGVWFVPLAPITDPTLVLPTLARTLGVDETAGRPVLARLQDHVCDKNMLLVLDNCEQVVDAAPAIADLLVTCGQIKVLTTSRTPLHLSGEHEFTVSPFALPTLAASVTDLAGNDAIRLFLARVRAFQLDFTLTPENARALVEICTRLEGIPLALELAAARLRQFTPTDLAATLRNPSASLLQLLTHGARDLPPRHQTLRNALAWSYDLLGANEQALFRRLGVFAGGCTMEAAIAIGDAGAADGIARLMDHGLLRLETAPGAQPRLVMLETLREFAIEQLIACGEQAAWRRWHTSYFLDQVAELDRSKRDRSKVAWLDKLERDLDNLRAALRWSLDNDPTQALALAGGLRELWYTRGYFSEGRDWLTQALAQTPAHQATSASQTAVSAVRAQALLAYAQLEEQQGDVSAALRLSEEALSIYQALDDIPGIAEALRTRGWVESDLGLPAAALHSFRESLRLFRILGDKAAIAEQLGAVAYCLCQGEVDYDEAKAYLDESLHLYRQVEASDGLAFGLERLGNLEIRFGHYQAAILALSEATTLARALNAKYLLASSLDLEGEAYWLLEDWQNARLCWQQAFDLFQELEVKWGVMILHHHLGQIERRAGNLTAAAERYRQSLSMAWDMQHERMIPRGLAGLGAVALAAGDSPRAAQLLAAAQRQFETLPPFLAPGDIAEFTQMIASARAALGAEEFARAWEQGAALPLSATIACALVVERA